MDIDAGDLDMQPEEWHNHVLYKPAAYIINSCLGGCFQSKKIGQSGVERY